MLEADEETRISMKDVQAHPWCTRSLAQSSPALHAKLLKLQEKQAALDAGAGLPRFLARDGNGLIQMVVQRAFRASDRGAESFPAALHWSRCSREMSEGAAGITRDP